MRNFSAVKSTNRWQSSLFGALRSPFAALSMTMSIPSNDCCTCWLKFSKSSLSKISQWWTEMPGDDWDSGALRLILFFTSLAFLRFTRITWQLCFEDRRSANSCDRLVSPFVIYLNGKKKRKWWTSRYRFNVISIFISIDFSTKFRMGNLI